MDTEEDAKYLTIPRRPVNPEIEEEGLKEFAATLRDQLYEDAIRNGSDLLVLDQSWQKIVEAQKEKELDPIKEKDPYEYRLIMEILRAKGDLRKSLKIEGSFLEDIYNAAYQIAKKIIQEGNVDDLYEKVTEETDALTVNIKGLNQDLPENSKGIFKYIILGLIELHIHNTRKRQDSQNTLAEDKEENKNPDLSS